MVVKEYVRARIDSAKRLDPGTETSTNFNYAFNETTKRITDIIISSVNIPFSFYEVNTTNNVVTFNSGATSITLPVGHYTASTIVSNLKTLIDVAFGDATTLVTYSSSTYRITINRGTSFIVDGVDDVPASIGAYVLGFQVSSPNSTTVTGDSVINISGPTHVNIESAYLTKNLSNKYRFIDISYSRILLSIPILSLPSNDITLVNNMPVSIKLGNKLDINNTDIIDIKITDNNNNPLDLNGRNITMDLIFAVE
jgi:hypothetical protein